MTAQEKLNLRGFDLAAFATANPKITLPLAALAQANAIAENNIPGALDEDVWPDEVRFAIEQIAVELARGSGQIITSESVDGYSYSLDATNTEAKWIQRLIAVAGLPNTGSLIGVPRYDTD